MESFAAILTSAAVTLIAAAKTSAQSTISGTEASSFAYSMNGGWIDFRPDATSGARIGEFFVSGYAYSGNFGWIHLGDGSPDNGYRYSNTSASDYGVNMGARGELSGYAYSPAIGWIIFDMARGSPRVDLSTGRFYGYAYCPNTGWINLNPWPAAVLSTASLSLNDTDGDGLDDAWETRWFGNLATAGSSSDTDRDGVSDAMEYMAGSDPMDASSFLRIIAHELFADHNGATLTFTSSPGRQYRIECAETPDGPWSDSGLGSFAGDWTASTTRGFGFPREAPKLFYRVAAQRPLSP